LALYEGRKPAAAQEAFLAFLELHPGSPLVPNALYWLGESYYAADKLDLAIMQFKRVAEAYPRHDKAAAALLKAGYAYARLNDKENARFYWQILLDDFPDSAPAALARKRLAGI
jgi:tol-pal system protein YbgF